MTSRPIDRAEHDTHGTFVGGSAAGGIGPRGAGPILADPLLAIAADVLDDIERVRIANENRLRQLTRTEVDSDGAERGFGLDDSHPDVARLAALVEMLGKVEHDATLNLQRHMRRHPLGPWCAAQVGIGEKQAARLLAAIGDPYWNTLHDRPRSVSELWAFAGYRPGQRRQKGIRSNWSASAKMRAFLIAESCIKHARSPYRPVYDERREHTAAAHPDWTAGHGHIDALRVVAKAILRDLWREAARHHDRAVGHSLADTHGGRADGSLTTLTGHGCADAHTASAGEGAQPEQRGAA